MTLDFDFRRFAPYTTQVATVLNDSRFATIPEELFPNSGQIFEQKLFVLLQDIQLITELDLAEQDSLQIESIIDRISFAQVYFFEEGFQKSIETYIDLYRLSDVEEEVEAYVQLLALFDELLEKVHALLEELRYPHLITTLNTLL